MKKKTLKALYVLAVGIIGFILVELGLIDGNAAYSTEGYPIDLDKAGDTVSVISVGQADSALISSGGKFCLIDAGETKSGDISVLEYLDAAGVKEIELLVITHFHADHTNEVLDVMDNYKINNIVIPNLEKKNIPTTKFFKSFLKKVEEQDINIKPAVKDSEYAVGNGTVKILADTYNDLSTNDTSVAALFVQDDFTFLSTGDGEEQYESRLVNDFNQKVTLFTAGHHGSSTSNTKEFITALNPDYVAISAGRDNEYGHPHKEVKELLEKLDIPYGVTSQMGTIVYSITENRLLTAAGF